MTGTRLELLERRDELATLAERLGAARRGEGGLLVIEGTAGIGKTRLLAEARAQAGDLRVLSARAGELEGEFPFGIVRQLFEPLVATATPERRAEVLSGAAELAAPIFATDAPVGAVCDVSFAVLHGLYWLTANAALEQPTVIAIDDLHWADTPSLRWLCYLVRRLEGLPLLVVAATRPPEQAREPELVNELLGDPQTTAIHPGPLNIASIAALARRRFDGEADPGFCAAVEAATRGNPLFVLALLDTVAREGIEPRADQAHVLLDLGPQVVCRAVSIRLSRLPGDARALIEAAATLGDGAALRHVGALARLEPCQAASAARLLRRSDLLLGEDPVEFFHPVVRTAIYENLDPHARSQAHRRAAELLIDAGVRPEQAAVHLLATVPASDAFVIGTLRDAAQRSLAQGASDAAVGYVQRALDEAPDRETRAELLVELGMAERLVDGVAAAEHLEAGLELLTDPHRRAQVAIELGSALFYVNRIPDAIAVFERALEETDHDADPDLHERLEAEFIASTWWVPETFPLAEARLRALDLDALHGGYGSDVLLADVAFYECRLAENRERAVAIARRAFASGGLCSVGALGFHFAAFAYVSAGHFDEAIAAYDAALAAAEKRGDVFRAAPILCFRGRTKALSGDLDGALTDLQNGLDLILAGQVDTALPYAVSFLAEVLLERGETDAAAAVLAKSGLLEDLPVSVHLFFFQLARGRLRLESGALERAVEELLVLGERTKVVVPFDNPVDYPWRRHAAEGLFRLGRLDEARVLAHENLQLARLWGAPSALGAALRTAGLVDGDLALLQEAVDILAGANARVEHARALVELGAALRRANKRCEARDRLRQGVELAHRAGATALIERANDELAATGARPRKLVVSGLESLTASERRVAGLAADGRSNKEIAQTLFVTVKTVELHLSNVYRKLAIGSRRHLEAALAASQGEPLLTL